MKEKFNTKKAKILIGILFGILIILIGILVYLQYLEKQEKEMIKEIKTYYNNYVITSRNTKIYNKNNKKIGIIKKNFILKLEKKRINTSKDQYFKIENKDFYVYYKDLKKTEKKGMAPGKAQSKVAASRNSASASFLRAKMDGFRNVPADNLLQSLFPYAYRAESGTCRRARSPEYQPSDHSRRTSSVSGRHRLSGWRHQRESGWACRKHSRHWP